MKKKLLISTALLCLFAATLVLSGCTKEPGVQPPNDPMISEKITLYFSDDQAMYLIPETREITVNKDTRTAVTIAEAIVKELIAGPANTKFIATIPKEAKLLSVKITDKIAYVDFSEEIKSKHPGGSTGELMTLNSLVNSLTELPEIQKVQILINGQNVETLAGHADLTQPLMRDETVIKK